MKKLIFCLYCLPIISWAQVTNIFPDSGNVGIGTTSPLDKLTVKGHVNIGDDANYRLRVRHVDGKSHVSRDVAALHLNYNNGKNVLVGWGPTNPSSDLLVAGRLGIGTTNPSSLLDIAYLGASNGDDIGLNFTLKGAKSSIKSKLMHATHNVSNLSFFTDPDGGPPLERMRITEDGNVGIGTNNPRATLEINKNFNGSAATFILNQSDSPKSRAVLLVGKRPTGGNYGYLAHFNANYEGNWGDYTYANSTWLSAGDVNGLNIIAGNSQGKIVFGTGSSEKMRLTANGNLGIGTTNPGSYKLAVNGNIRAKEIKVETGWADYVFSEDYDLPTLKEVERHIQEKGHLINIPSAKEVKANGIQLGEMNRLLLEKIEELTLYTIQQQKDIQGHQKTIVLLAEKLETVQQEIDNPKN